MIRRTKDSIVLHYVFDNGIAHIVDYPDVIPSRIIFDRRVRSNAYGKSPVTSDRSQGRKR